MSSHWFHRSRSLRRHGTVAMEPGDQSSARLSEINQHSSRRWVIEYSRRARYRNVMNLIRSKTVCDPSPVTTVIEFPTHPAIEAFTFAAVYLETIIQNSCGSDSSGNFNAKALRLDFCVWMKAAAAVADFFFWFCFDECCASCTRSRDRLWMGWSQQILGCD